MTGVWQFLPQALGNGFDSLGNGGGPGVATVRGVSRTAVSRDLTSAEGFTLVEVLVAVGMVSVLIAGAAGLLASASRAIRAGRLGTTATFLALQKVEQLRANPATGVVQGAFEDYAAADGTPGTASVHTFVRRWTLTPAGAGAAVWVEVFSPGVGRVAELRAVVGHGTPGAP